MKTLLIVALLLVGLGCEKKDVETTCVEQPKTDCVCTYEYKPVCGCNGKTYGNACEAACVGVQFTEGACAGN